MGLENLKPGDEVIYSPHYYGSAPLDEMAIVEAVTPTGLIKVKGELFYSDGRFRGSGWTTPRLRAATPEAKSEAILWQRKRKAAARFSELSDRVNGFRRIGKLLAPEKLEAVNKAMDELLESV